MKTLDFKGFGALSLPDEWIGAVIEPQTVVISDTAATIIAAALAHPIESAPLNELVRAAQRVAIIVDDYTRKTPIEVMLPQVLRALHGAGVPDQNISIVIALGTHRPLTTEELTHKLGADMVDRYTVINVPSTRDDEFVYLCTASNGLPAYIQRVVAQAEVRIGLGMITPHLDAGFSGGMKIVLPGVCGTRTVDAFHRQSAFIEQNQLGQIDAPLRRTLEQFVSERMPLTFIVNAVITTEGTLYACVAGHPLHAHRAGVKHALTVFSAPVSRRYPIVVTNCAPYDIDLWQSIKGIWAGDLITEDGGTLIAVTAAPEGNSQYPLVPSYAGRDAAEVKREIEAGTALDDKQAATGVMFRTLMKRIKLVLVSLGLTADDAQAMGVDYHQSVSAAVAAEIDRLPIGARTGSIGVVPQAGIVLPVIE